MKSQIALGIAIVMALVGAAYWCVLISYRGHRYIQVRGLSAIFFSAGLWTLGAIIWNLAIALQWPCFPIAAFLHIFHVIIAFSTTERCFMVLVNFAINQEAVYSSRVTQKSRHIESYTPITGQDSPFSKAWSKWIFEHRKYFTADWSSPSKVLMLGIASIFSLIGILCIGLMGGNHNSAFCSSDCYGILILYWRAGLISGGIACNIAFMSAVRFLKVQENFLLKQEMAMFGVLAFPVALSLMYRSFAPIEMQITYDTSVMWFGVVFLFIVPVLIMGVMMYVVSKARQEIRQSKHGFVTVHSGNSSSVQTSSKAKNFMEEFLQMLNIEPEREEFKLFLIVEFSVENLLFWEAVHFLKEIESFEAKRNKALQTVEDFCSDKSKHEVNLSFSQSSSLKISAEKLFRASADIEAQRFALNELLEHLQTAKEDIESLMFENSYRRFKRHRQVKVVRSSVQQVQIVNEEQNGFSIDSLTI
jgi:hypothetical protein